VAEALEIQEIHKEFLREAGFNLTDLRNQVQLTYWSEQHFITQSLIELLPFGEILSDIRFYSYVDYSLDKLISKANQTLLYWRLSGITQYDRTPITQLSLFYDETFLWHYSAPSYREEIRLQIQSGHRVRFLSRFLLLQTEIEVEFNEIRLQTNFNDDFQFVYTNSNTYQYKFANLRWQPIRTILSFPLINPPTFSLPITVPNALGRETKYQAYLSQVQGLPNNIHIQDHYWDSVDSTPVNTLGPTRINTPSTGSDTDYWTLTNFQFASPTAESGSTNSTHPCACGTDICYCDTRQPGTPPTPAGISLWNPKYSNQPINGLHYNRTLQTGASSMISSSSRPPEIQFFPRYTPVHTF